MRPLFTTFLLLPLLLTMASNNPLTAQNLDFSKVKAFEHQLDDVMEIIDTVELTIKLKDVEAAYQQHPTEINKARLGIIYHETALNLSFFSETASQGYAQKSFDILSELYHSPTTTQELLPFVASYRASALSLVSAETRNLTLLGEAFTLFGDAVDKYAEVSSQPEFLRGSVAENLPWFFYKKRKFAKKDFQSIIEKQNNNDAYANWKIMSFTYWAWANQRQGKKYTTQSLAYLDKAIALDPEYQAGRQRAEDLKAKMTK